jgi:hypothetical protein
MNSYSARRVWMLLVLAVLGTWTIVYASGGRVVSSFPSPLVVTDGGTGLTTVTTGDTLFGLTANVYSRLPIGSPGQILTVDPAGTAPIWSTNSGGGGGGGVTSITATPPLSASSSTGAVTVAIVDPLTVPYGGTGLATVVTGDTLFASTANILSRLPIGSPGQVYTVNTSGTAPIWSNSTGGGGGSGNSLSILQISKTTTQTVASSGNTAITWDTNTTNTGGGFSHTAGSSTITVNTAGVVLLNWALEFNCVASKSWLFQVYQNGVALQNANCFFQTPLMTTASGSNLCSWTVSVNCNAGDTLVLEADAAGLFANTDTSFFGTTAGGFSGLFAIQVPSGGSGVGTWGQSLANGKVSGGTNPTLSTGDMLMATTAMVVSAVTGITAYPGSDYLFTIDFPQDGFGHGPSECTFALDTSAGASYNNTGTANVLLEGNVEVSSWILENSLQVPMSLSQNTTCTSTVTVANTGAATNLFSLGLPANALRAYGSGWNTHLVGHVDGALSTLGSSPGTYTVAIKFGSASFTLVNGITPTAGLSSSPVMIDFDLAPTNAASSGETITASYMDGSLTTPKLIRGTSTQSLASTQNVVITVQFGTASTSNTFVMDNFRMTIQ